MNRLLVFSGAGLSAESGIPTFRDNDGLWNKFKIDDVANFNNFEKNKEMILSFYAQRRREMSNAQPNVAHIILSDLQEEFGPEQVIHFTQNIDDLLERAGSKLVNHVHGFIHEAKCLDCSITFRLKSELNFSTTCPKCDGRNIKPGVIMFNEVAPLYGILKHTFDTATTNDIVLVIGTNGQVVSPTWIVNNPAYKILISPDPGVFSPLYFNEFYQVKCGVIMPRLKNFLREHLLGVE